ncbi:hypothetical protein QR680_015062 [Steinernema hermaphroditum]|uniref:AAA+ ATPase domain-containing protein n=1 Tax=Steinernema hermaphroditum TaxID=289476 RepID=A0AA39ICL1_9BILA|nr:hypothetical protein QR680_015062 [Steinernema hermaphroditum]
MDKFLLKTKSKPVILGKRPSSFSSQKPAKRTMARAQSFEAPSRKLLFPDPFEKCEPTKVLELAVQKTRVKQVQDWLENWIANGGNPYLILMGPPGCGKSTTVKIVCKSLGISVTEYESTEEYFVNDERLIRETDETSFLHFLRSMKYRDVTKKGKGKKVRRVLIIDEFPPAILERPELLHSAVAETSRNVPKHATCAVVFILTFGAGMSWGANSNRLFPANIRAELNLKCIEFQRITDKMMKTALAEAKKKIMLNIGPDEMETLVEQSNGDVRRAIHQALLWFPDNSSLWTAEDLPPQAEFITDLHVIGRILHAKHNAPTDEQRRKGIRPEPIYTAAMLTEKHPTVPLEFMCNMIYSNYLQFNPSLQKARQISKCVSNICSWWEAFKFELRDHSPDFERCLKQVLIANVTEANYRNEVKRMVSLKREELRFGKEKALLNFHNGRFLFPGLIRSQQHMTETVCVLKEEFKKNPKQFDRLQQAFLSSFPETIDIMKQRIEGRIYNANGADTEEDEEEYEIDDDFSD